jgi:hypothetical protein
MKKNCIVLIILFIVLTQSSFSQSLLIKGFFKDVEKKSIQVEYILQSNNKVIYRRSDKKIKIELELNNDYVLIVSKDGFVSKTVSFSTQTNKRDDFYVEFEVCLKGDDSFGNSLSAYSAKVYYDNKLRAFNYEINKKQH